MGCSICLETYEDDADKGKKPVALPCGHIFHRACSDSWLKSCRNRSDPPCCPLCKYPMGLAKAQALYPGDVTDLDVYLANRNRRVAHQKGDHGIATRTATSTTNALDRHMTKEAQGELLECLMDFRQHISSYVMSVNEVAMPTRRVEQQTLSLFKKATKNDLEKQGMFHDSLAALTAATSVLNETISATEEMRRDIERRQSAIVLETDLLEQKRRRVDKHYATKEREEQAMHETRERVKRLEMHLKKELSDVARERAKMEAERKSYMQEARDKEHEAMKAKLDSAQILAQKEGDVRVEMERMKNYVYQQETLRIQAEDQAREAKGKSSLLADRNKLLSDKLTSSRAEVKRLKALGGSSEISGASSSSKIADARPVKAEKQEGSWDLLDSEKKGKARHDSRVPSQTQWDDDGFVEVGYRAGSRRQHKDGPSDYPSAAYGSSQKRPRFTEEQDDSAVLIIDSDNEGLDFDDGNYPMPGFQLFDRKAKPESSATRNAAAAPSSGDDSVELVGDNMGNTRNSPRGSSSNAGLIQSILNARNLSFGPRRRAR